MFRVAVFALIIALFRANAFMAPRVSSNRVALSMKLDIVGSTAPLGFFDPFGLSKGKNDATILQYREAELKHGRVSMLAAFGWLTQERFHPVYNGKLSGNPLKAAFEVPPFGYLQIFLFCGLIEYIAYNAKASKDYKAGDILGLGALNRDPNDSSWVSFQNRELNNGRLAMIGILGMIVHAAITGQGALEQIGI